MKVRIKFQKYGAMKFIGHLDVMRYFQKAFRRAGIKSEYSKGFNPHQIMSFAAPLGLGLTSDGEYLDAELISSDEPKQMIDKLNAVMTEGFRVTAFHILKDREVNQKAVTAMSLVSSADYIVSLKDGYTIMDTIQSQETFQEAFTKFYNQENILIEKKTKTSQQIVDIKPMITMFAFDEKEYLEKRKAIIDEDDNNDELNNRMDGSKYAALDSCKSAAEVFDNGIKVYLQLDTGSAANLKPELVMEAFYQFLAAPFNKFAWQVHRLEIYTREEENGKLISLDKLEK
ncbi:MAG: DUF2344 domain-containing protein [Clostridiales bacterium]|nr:DUF2344 domain-containing protein [Clostridiales bacterium]